MHLERVFKSDPSATLGSGVIVPFKVVGDRAFGIFGYGKRHTIVGPDWRDSWMLTTTREIKNVAWNGTSYVGVGGHSVLSYRDGSWFALGSEDDYTSDGTRIAVVGDDFITYDTYYERYFRTDGTHAPVEDPSISDPLGTLFPGGGWNPLSLGGAAEYCPFQWTPASGSPPLPADDAGISIYQRFELAGGVYYAGRNPDWYDKSIYIYAECPDAKPPAVAFWTNRVLCTES